MKKYIPIIIIILFLSNFRSWAQNNPNVSKTEQRIERDKKEAGKLQYKAEKKQRKMERKEKRMKRKERKGNMKLRRIKKEEKKLDRLQNESKNSAFITPVYRFTENQF